MPQRILEYRVVVASPSDMFKERKVVFETLNELNRSLDSQNIFLRGLGWEEYATPGVDAEPQTLINKQLLRDYDILIALFGSRLGSPTKSEKSGTVEEIEKALSQDTNMKEHRVQIYFRDKVDSLSAVSIDDLQELYKFRDYLKDRGVLYKEYSDDSELAREIRVNIYRTIIRSDDSVILNSSIDISNTNKTDGRLPVQEETDSCRIEEPGFLDLMENADDSIAAALEAVTAITSSIENITSETNINIRNLEQISSPEVPAKAKKAVINGFADFLQKQASQLLASAVKAGDNFAKFFNTQHLIVGMQEHDAAIGSKLNEKETSESVNDFIATIIESRESISSFRSTIEFLHA